MASSQEILLDTFRDNNSMLISAADMRELINALYAENVSIEAIIDNLLSIEATEVLSANQGRILKVLIDALQMTINSHTQSINSNTTALANLSGGITTAFQIPDGRTVTVTNGVITNLV